MPCDLAPLCAYTWGARWRVKSSVSGHIATASDDMDIASRSGKISHLPSTMPVPDTPNSCSSGVGGGIEHPREMLAHAAHALAVTRAIAALMN